MPGLKDLQLQVLRFRDARNWKQFHNPKDMAISMTLESAEFLEHFQWKSPDEIKQYLKNNHKDVSEELCDVLYWVLLIAYDLDIDIEKEFNFKMAQNEKKYPISKSKGKHTKYTELN